MAPSPARSLLVLLVALGTACPDDPPSTSGGPSDSSGSSTSSTTDSGPSTTTGDPGTTGGTGSATGEGSSDSGMADSTDTGTSTTDGGSSSGSSDTTGPLPDVGCADGEREALLDDVMYPDLAACSGGWSFPGVLNGTPMCNNMAGDDGPIPNGMGCTMDDLCAEGWHLCESAMEVSDAGIADCGDAELMMQWNNAFFATRQSGNGTDTCGPIGTNDVFGCGDIGHDTISGCAPLNRSTGNTCVALPAPWECPGSDVGEANQLVKEAPENGGVLCCRD